MATRTGEPGIFGPPNGGPDTRRPQAPRNFIASTPEEGTITVRWDDQGTSNGFGAFSNPVIVQTWFVYVCTTSLAGTASGNDPLFKFSVRDKGRIVGSIASSHRGDPLRLTLHDPAFTGIYVTVAGISVDGIEGVPAEPQLLYTGAIPVGPLDPPTAVSLNLTAITDNYGNHFVDLNPTYTAPLILGRFVGVAIHAEGYLGGSEIEELGNLIVYRKGPGGQEQSGHIYMPRDEGHFVTTVYFVAVDQQGKRDPDITTAPTVGLIGGIYA